MGEGVVDRVRLDHPAFWAAPSEKERTGNRIHFIILILTVDILLILAG